MKKQTSEISFSDKGSMSWSDGGDFIQFASEEDVMKFQVFLMALDKEHQDEKKKWKEEMMEIIGEDEVMPTIIETPETEFLIKKIPAHIGRNEFRQQLRVKLKNL